MGTTEEANKYLDRGYYLSLTGYLCKVCRLISNRNLCENELN